MAIAMVVVFFFGYALIVVEHLIKINKGAVALLTGVTCWSIFILGSDDFHEVSCHLMEHTSDIAGILFFLIGAMTIVKTIDLYHGFDAITGRLTSAGHRQLLWLVVGLSFFLSSILDNLTTTIVMVSLLSKLPFKRDELLRFIGVVIVSVNAGGAWSPIGDVTTTMLWIGGQITTGRLIVSLIVPSLICALVPSLWVFASLKKGAAPRETAGPAADLDQRHRHRTLVLVLGIACLLLVPVFKSITHLPPFVGMLFGLGMLWVVTEQLRRSMHEKGEENRSVVYALQRIDMATIMFFLGILLSITALEAAGVLTRLGTFLEHAIGNVFAEGFLIGLLSAVVDNVPLVAAAMKMYPLSFYPADHEFWIFLSYCAGTGGSVLIIGSAAGVAAMGMAKITFFWYLKKIAPLALAGYAAGAAAFLVQSKLF